MATFEEKLKKEASLRKKIQHVYRFEDEANRLNTNSIIHLTPTDMKVYLEIRSMWDPKHFKKLLNLNDFSTLCFQTYSFKIICDLTDNQKSYLSVE